MVLAFLAGIGGGAFSGLMPSTSYFFPKSKRGTALGLQAGIGNLGVSIVQLLTPYLIAIGALAVFGGSQQMKFPGKPDQTVWYQNAAFVWIPLMIGGAILAWTMLKSVPIKANIKQQFDIFKNQDTWWMTILHHDLRHLFGSVGAVRPAHDQPLRRGQRGDRVGLGCGGQGARRGVCRA